ncbi:T9SS type A sorting domain-containing protein, partial [candidate division KSB1 bacterium]|nr:T9SS type A sorting domain-containing protein [candidate division KSB1 bacterium]
ELQAFYAKYGALPPPPPFSVSSDQSAVFRPADYGLSQNYPNPFNPETVIEYQLPQPAKVSLKIYNLLGREIRSLVDREMPAGYHRVKWDGRDDAGRRLDSGVYLYKIHVGNFMQTRKTLLLK